jgi:TetR/AcrR family transcriptional regulator, transcriptional repressor for nem operon
LGEIFQDLLQFCSERYKIVGMARPRAFDEQEVLTAAMHAFRREGYSHISVAALEAATGLRTSSLYHAFGDKAGLFRRALDHYVSTLVAPRLATYAGAEATLDDLEQLFLTLFHAPYDDGYGCLVVNSAAEFGSADSIAGDGVRAAMGLVHRHIEDVVRRELEPAAAKAHAARLMLLYQGVLVLSRAGLLTSQHQNAISHEFDALRQEKEHRP